MKKLLHTWFGPTVFIAPALPVYEAQNVGYRLISWVDDIDNQAILKQDLLKGYLL